MIEVIKSGLYSTVQDLGRSGFAHLGVPVSGVMDQFSAKLANEIVGNHINAAVIEMTLIGGVFKFNCDTCIAITGADMLPKLNGLAVSTYKPIKIDKGDLVSFSASKNGCRTYIAVSGGVKTQKVLNSRSLFKSVTTEGSLKNDDMLSIDEQNLKLKEVYSKIKNQRFDQSILEVFPGPEFDSLSPKQQELMFSSQFTISNLNNRMGYQLSEVMENNLNSIITSAVLPGTVQLTPGGKLIILMRDAQTTGGYPRVLQLSDQAISLLAQKKTSDKVTFSLITMNQF